jgi:hypothetical protein
MNYDVFVTEICKTVLQLQYFEFLNAVFLNIQVFWYIALCAASQRNLVLSSSGVKQLTHSDSSWANWVMVVISVTVPCPEYPVKPQNTLESCCTEHHRSNDLVAPGGAGDIY